MLIQHTLSIIKPDAVKSEQIGPIYTRFSQAGLKIIAAKLYRIPAHQAEQFYGLHRGKDFFEGLIQLITSGPSMIQILPGEDAIACYRTLLGPTDPALAPPGSLRAEFGGKQLPANGFHGSDRPESAAWEIPFFFSQEIYETNPSAF